MKKNKASSNLLLVIKTIAFNIKEIKIKKEENEKIKYLKELENKI